MTETPPSQQTPASLVGDWRVQDIAGRPILREGPVTIRIESDGRFSGRTGCNHITGSIALDGAALRFTKIAMTRMMCPPALMDQERRLVQALEATRAFHVEDDGCLSLEGAYEPFLLRALRPPRISDHQEPGL